MANTGFNPVKEETDGIKAKRMIWTTKALDLALKGLDEGRKLVANPFYENNTKLLKGDLVFERTDEEIEDFRHCMADIIYFVTKCKLMTPEGIQHITLRDYQEKYLQHLMDHRLSIYLACRQCSKTTMSAIFLLHYILFNTDKNALVLGNKRKTAVEILDKIKKIYLELPYYLKPGVYKWNEGEIVFDNGCRIMAEATTINSGISFTFHCVLADEFAHIAPNIKDKFYNNLFPTITAGKARFMITSTQNGFDLFSRLYLAAVAGDNEYAPFKTDWYEVPEWNPELHCWEPRDEEWHRLQVANYGSEEAFNKQFGTNFDVGANTLIDSKVLKARGRQVREFIHKPMDNAYANYFWWHPDFDIENLRNEHIIITTDIAEGLGGDYTINMINRVYVEDGTIKTQAVGYFKCNDHDVNICVDIIRKFCIQYLDPIKYLFSLEYNLFGELYVRTMKQLMDEDVANYDKFGNDNIVRYYNDEQTKFLLGVRMTPKTKLLAVTQFKQYYEKGVINNDARQFFAELEQFCDNKGNNTFQASFGHDDLVMSQLQVACVMDTPQYREFISLLNMGGASYDTAVDLYGGMGSVPDMDIFGGTSMPKDTEDPWAGRFTNSQYLEHKY